MVKDRYYFTVEEVARELGISKQTILRYEKRGIFPKPHRNPINHWRQYSSRDIKNLKKILGR
ncbi:MAG: MerR family transcriptional regulator [Candidatus Omnitrophota bacterium]|nr:MerR family transcriptional regulator [Candidatus Omnitrophota bacterium]MBU1524309.1 MerR family transcriptional regulator [Candidatus Omnitrophota bacterium]MBU2436663.1 MerR family transcriptional regulator [Candidatus Omnitrophota bacterium]MBU2504554.1 MerR family transcriptional regulator [Candidatus Omnitrophota bacterium]